MGEGKCRGFNRVRKVTKWITNVCFDLSKASIEADCECSLRQIQEEQNQ